ncbi:MAG TPA: ABC-type transport auxiliary lipoprotein family protein [Povalibacter sp.]
MKITRTVTIVALALAAAACGGSLFESDLPAPTYYVLKTPAAAAQATASPASSIDLAIGRPDVGPGLDTDRIAVVRGNQLDFYRGALWGGTVLETVQTFLVGAFQDQQLFRSVAAEQSRITADYLLDIEVRDFQAEYGAGAAPAAHVTLVCRLIRIRDRQLLDTITTTASRPASQESMSAVAAAFEAAMQQVSLDLASKTADRVARSAQQTQTAGADR